MSNHLEICQIVINNYLQFHLREQVGDRYTRFRSDEQSSYRRYGYNPGSVRAGNQKIKVDVPRIKNMESNQVENLGAYESVRDLPEQKEEMVRSVLKGISMRDYHDIATTMTDSFGLSPSSISNHFVEYTAQKLEAFFNARIEENFVALFIDGKYLQHEQMLIVLGVTDTGRKKVLSVVQMHGERSKPIAEMLEELITRALDVNDGILVVSDGSKGLLKGIETAFGDKAIIQRCQWHKRENVMSYLDDEQQLLVKKEMQGAYSQNDYLQAKAQLEKLAERLKKVNLQAHRSLMEGMEETLIIHRLGLAEDLRKSFMTTNIIESLNSAVSKHTAKVKNWSSSDQRYRWVVMASLEAEKTFHKVNGYKKLHLLFDALKKEVTLRKSSATIIRGTPNDSRISTKN